MKAFYSDHYKIPLPQGHRFPIEKYSLLRQRILAGELAEKFDLCVPGTASNRQIRRVHTQEYLDKILTGRLSDKEIRRIGFPWSRELVERSRRSVGGTIGACRAALKDGLAANLAGGTHHAYPDHGQGYCLLNDVAIAARTIQADGQVEKILILDCDVHQGNGSAAIFAGDPSVYTFSIHGARNFPFHKEPSDLDIALPDDAGDSIFLEALSAGIERALTQVNAELVIYIAGADPYKNDRLGRLALSKDGLARRDRMVLERCLGGSLSAAIVLGGGYAKQVEDTVDIHYETLRIAAGMMGEVNKGG